MRALLPKKRRSNPPLRRTPCRTIRTSLRLSPKFLLKRRSKPRLKLRILRIPRIPLLHPSLILSLSPRDEITAPFQDPRLTALYEGHRIHYIDSKKQPLPKNAELFMNEINEDDVPFYLQRAAHSLGLESCGMYLYFIADPLLEDASTAEILKYQANPDDPEDRMTVEVTLIDDSKMTDEEKELRLEELQNIHLEDLQVIQLGAYWDYDTILPHSEENGVIRFEIEKIAPFILFIPDWESAVQISEEPEPAEVPEEIAAPTEDTGTQQVTEPVDQPAELAPVPEETVSEVPVRHCRRNESR